MGHRVLGAVILRNPEPLAVANGERYARVVAIVGLRESGARSDRHARVQYWARRSCRAGR